MEPIRTFSTLVKKTSLLIQKAAHQKDLLEKPLIIIGLSGGPDSVFLLHLLHQLFKQGDINLIAAHLNHQWRAEAGEDEAFCQKLCQHLEIPLVVGKAQELAITIKYNGSKEDVGRQLRRSFFKQILSKYNAHFVALAHHQQDQQETFFIRMLRGSSLSGLRCMDEIDDVYLRPLLHTNKEYIMAWLNHHNISSMHDATNDSDSFLRNRIRKYVLPALTRCDKRFDQKFESTLAHLKEEDLFLQKLTTTTFASIFTYNSKLICWQGNLKEFRISERALQRRLLIYWFITEKASFIISDAFINEALRFLHQPQGKAHIISSNLIIHKKHNIFWLTTLN